MANESDSQQRINNKPGIRRWLVLTGFMFVVAAVLITAVGIPVVRSRSVAFYIRRTPIPQAYVTAMVTDLPFDPTSEFYKTRPDLLDPASPKYQYLVSGLNKEAVERLVVMYAQMSEAAKLGITVSASDVEQAVEKYVNEHVLTGDADEAARLRSPEMRSYISLRGISVAYEDRSTRDTTLTPQEVSDYFATWSWRYVNSNGVQQTFGEVREQVTRDALANKKFQQVLLGRHQLLNASLPETDGDTRFKQFMRWWNVMFGIKVPDALLPLQFEASS